MRHQVKKNKRTRWKAKAKAKYNVGRNNNNNPDSDRDRDRDCDSDHDSDRDGDSDSDGDGDSDSDHCDDNNCRGHDNDNYGGDDDNSEDNEGQPRPGPSRPSKSSPGDARDPQRVQAWEELFGAINEALHIASMLVERLNPDLARQYYKLSEALKADAKKHGEFLSFNECCLPGVAVHFNMAPDDNEYHWDRMSMFVGWESVSIH